MIIHAVVDTNILVSGMLTSNETAPTRQILAHISTSVADTAFRRSVSNGPVLQHFKYQPITK